jgi:ligand-binding sensor domain-containing protein
MLKTTNFMPLANIFMVNLIKEKVHFILHALNDRMKSVKNILAIFVLVIFSFFIAPVVIADEITNILSFDYFSQMDGLPNNQVQCIFQDKKGWIWIGTNQGLSRFDGYRFVNFVHNNEDTSSLSGSLVRVIFEDKKGNLLIGTENGGLNVFDREKERFLHPYKNHPEFKSKEVSVNSIDEGPDGSLGLIRMVSLKR